MQAQHQFDQAGIIVMAERRSKSGLMRREDNIERGLLSGEQSPHSAIDTMKWLSGFLDAAQFGESGE